MSDAHKAKTTLAPSTINGVPIGGAGQPGDETSRADEPSAAKSTAPSPAASPLRFPLPTIPTRSAQKLDEGLHTVSVYAAGATHLRDLVKPLGITVVKIGVTGCRDAQARAADLRRKRYASILTTRLDSGEMIDRILPYGHEWFLMPFVEQEGDAILWPERIRLADGVLKLRIAQAVSVEDVNKALHDVLRTDRCFAAYLASPEGQRLVQDAGHAGRISLFTPYTLMTEEVRLSRTEELYLLRPRRELKGLVALLKTLIERLEAQARAKSRTG